MPFFQAVLPHRANCFNSHRTSLRNNELISASVVLRVLASCSFLLVVVQSFILWLNLSVNILQNSIGLSKSVVVARNSNFIRVTLSLSYLSLRRVYLLSALLIVMLMCGLVAEGVSCSSANMSSPPKESDPRLINKNILRIKSEPGVASPAASPQQKKPVENRRPSAPVSSNSPYRDKLDAMSPTSRARATFSPKSPPEIGSPPPLDDAAADQAAAELKAHKPFVFLGSLACCVQR